MAWDRVRDPARVLRHDVQTAVPRINQVKQVCAQVFVSGLSYSRRVRDDIQ